MTISKHVHEEVWQHGICCYIRTLLTCKHSLACQTWHDDAKATQVAGELEVKAQIKLRINTATQQPVVIIRSFQVCSLMGTDILLSGFRPLCDCGLQVAVARECGAELW